MDLMNMTSNWRKNHFTFSRGSRLCPEIKYVVSLVSSDDPRRFVLSYILLRKAVSQSCKRNRVNDDNRDFPRVAYTTLNLRNVLLLSTIASHYTYLST